jgi:hypothetical protein
VDVCHLRRNGTYHDVTLSRDHQRQEGVRHRVLHPIRCDMEGRRCTVTSVTMVAPVPE